MGSIQASLVPKEDMLAKPCNDLATNVSALLALGLGCSVKYQLGVRFYVATTTYLLAGQTALG